jgi:hypothetical protein
MGLLLVIEMININGEVIILRNSDMKSSKTITLEALNIFDSSFFDVSPDIREYKKQHEYSKDQVEDISKSLAQFRLKSPTKDGKHIFLPIRKNDKKLKLFQKFRLKSRIVSKTMFDLALRFKVGEKPYFYEFLEKYKLKYIAQFLEKFKFDAKTHEEISEIFNLSSYNKYFSKNQSTFLRLTIDIENLQPHITEKNKVSFIETTHRLLIYLIREHLYTAFISEYGIKMFPKLIPMCDDLSESIEENIQDGNLHEEGVTYYKNKFKDLVTNLANLATFIKEDDSGRRRGVNITDEGDKNFLLSLDFDLKSGSNIFQIVQNSKFVS